MKGENNVERDSFIFYIEYKEALNLLKSEKQKLQFYELLTEYVFYNNIPQNIDEEIKAMFILIKKRLDKRNQSYWNYEERRSNKYKKWKEQVLKRDNYKCQKCGTKQNLVVHHIKAFAIDKALRFDIDNGITLCKDCQKEVHQNER